MSKTTWTWVRALLSAAALAWVLSRTPFRSVLEILQSCSVPLAVAGVALNVVTRLAAAERTQVMNRALGLLVTRAQTIATLFVSNFYALLSPGPWLSGVVTVYRYKSLGASFTGSISSLLASRAVEALAFLFWGAAFALCDAHLDRVAARSFAQYLFMIMSLAAVLAIAGWAWHHRRPEKEPLIMTKRMPRLAKLREMGAQLLRMGPAVTIRAAVPATIQLLMSGAGLVLLARAVGCDMAWTSGMWIAAVVYAVVLLPISIAGLGVRDVTLVKCFAMLGFAPRAAVAVSLLLLLDQLISAAIGAVLQLSTTLAPASASAIDAVRR